MAISRTVAGLLLEDDFDRADSSTLGGDWVERAGDWSIDASELEVASNSTDWAENSAASRQEAFVQLVVRQSRSGNVSSAVWLRFDWNGGSQNGYGLFWDYNGNTVALRKLTNGSFSNLGTDQAKTLSADIDYPGQFYVAAGTQEAWIDGVTNEAADTDHDALSGTLGLRVAGATSTRNFDDAILCRTNKIIVTGLSAGQKAKVRNAGGTVVAEATESGGTATINVSRYEEEQSAGTGATELFPIGGWAELIVTESDDTIVETYNATGVYPGDEYEVGVAAAPVLTSAETSADGTEIRLTFDKDMADPTGEHGAFSFEEDAAGRSFSAAALASGDATTIVLTVDGTAIAAGATVTASYDDTSGSVESSDGGVLASFTDESVTNLVAVESFPLTVAPGKVDSDLSDFPIYVQLSDMPTEFWDASELRADGGNIRVRDESGSEVPIDLIHFDATEETGTLFFLAATVLSAEWNEWTVAIVDSGVTAPDPTDANGRNAVWADYEAVVAHGDDLTDRAGGSDLTAVQGSPHAFEADTDLFFEQIETSPDVNSHQGVTFDGSHYYTFDNNAIRKWDLDWTLVTQNTDPKGDSGESGNLTDGFHHNGTIYVGINGSLLSFDASDLSYITKVTVTGTGSHGASQCLSHNGNTIISVDHPGATVLNEFGFDGVSVGEITLSATIDSAQGITFWGGYYWINTDRTSDKRTYKVATDGTIVSTGVWGISTDNLEGIDSTDDALLVLEDGGTVETVRMITPRLPPHLAPGGGLSFTEDTKLTATVDSAPGDQWTIGVSIRPSSSRSVTANQRAAGGFSGGGLFAKVVVDDGERIGVWDTNDAWLYTDPEVDPSMVDAHRVHVAYDSTTARHIWHNGGKKNSESGITGGGSGGSTFFLGHGGDVEYWRGDIGFAYLRHGVLSDDWIAAEYDMLSEPSEFSSLGSAPRGPTLEGSADGTQVSLSTSAFEAVTEGQAHAETQWQVQLAGGDWSSLIVDELTSDFLTVALFGELDGIPANEAIEARAKHIDDVGEESEWSNVVTLDTEEALPTPDQPVLTIEELFVDSVRTSRTAFSHSEGTQDPPDGTEDDPDDTIPWHLASRYEIRDRATQAEVLDTGFSSEYTALEQFFEELGDPGGELEVRVTDQDGKYGTESLPSEWVPFDLLSPDALRPDKPTITVDVCDPEATEVSGDAYSSPDSPASPHAATRWWVGVGPLTDITWRSVLTEDASELTSFTWPHLPPGVWRLAVSYQDEAGRWSDRSEPESCEIETPPAQPFITQPLCSGLVDSDLAIEWEMLTGATEDFEYTGELAGPLASDAVADTWTALFTRQTSNTHTLDISGLEDGEYVFRVKACILSEGQCGEWAYLTVTIDRTGEATLSVPYNFADLSSLPSTWDQAWGTDHVTFALVDKTLREREPYVGILAKNHQHNALRTSVLRFNELGEPTDMDATIVMAWVPRDSTWYGWRFAYTQYLHGGLGWRILTAAETGDGLNGVFQVGHGGGPLHPFPSGCEANEEVVCPCKFVTDGVCRGGTAYNAVLQEENPGQWIRYGRGGTPGWRLHRYRPASSVPTILTRAAEVEGDPKKGTIQSRQVPEDDCDTSAECEFNFTWYVQRFRIRRETSTHTRFQAAVLGPGVDPAQGWHINELVKTKELGLNKDDEILCGPCGLAFRHMQNLTKDHGVLFRCARFTIYDDEVSTGPILGTASLVED